MLFTSDSIKFKNNINIPMYILNCVQVLLFDYFYHYNVLQIHIFIEYVNVHFLLRIKIYEELVYHSRKKLGLGIKTDINKNPSLVTLVTSRCISYKVRNKVGCPLSL